VLTRDLNQSQTNKEKTDLLICGTLGVHLIQNTKENKIGSDYKDDCCHEKKCACQEADGVHILFIIYETRLTWVRYPVTNSLPIPNTTNCRNKRRKKVSEPFLRLWLSRSHDSFE